MSVDTFVTNAAGKNPTIEKDPNAKLDYTFDWTAWLDLVGDAISVASCVATSDGSQGVSDIAVTQTVVVGKTVVAWVTGGLVGEKVALRCRITTTLASPGPRIEDRTVYLKIKER